MVGRNEIRHNGFCSITIQMSVGESWTSKTSRLVLGSGDSWMEMGNNYHWFPYYASKDLKRLSFYLGNCGLYRERMVP